MTSAKRLADCVKSVVEQLEGRRMFAITIDDTGADLDGNLIFYVRGNSKNDTIYIEDDAVNTEVRVRFSLNGPTTTYDYPGDTPFTIFDVDLKGGNDRIDFRYEFDEANDPQTENYITTHRTIALDGDTGNDTIDLTIPGGITQGSEIVVDIDGDSGNDNITLDFDYMADSKLDIDLKGGEGNDSALVNLPALLDGNTGVNYNSVVTFDADTGNGKNLLDVNAASTIYYDGLVDVDIKGGNSTGKSFDTINLDFSNSAVEGKLFVVVNALSGDDRVSMLLDNLYVETSDSTTASYAPAPVVTFNINGNDGKDLISTTADTAGIYVDETAFLSLIVRGGNQDDTITTNLTGPVDVALGGQMVLDIDGQNNNDRLVTDLNFADKGGGGFAGGGGQFTLAIKGGQQSDRIDLDIVDQSTNKIIFGPGLFGALIDGQTNTDRLDALTVGLLQAPLYKNFESGSHTDL